MRNSYKLTLKEYLNKWVIETDLKLKAMDNTVALLIAQGHGISSPFVKEALIKRAELKEALKRHQHRYNQCLKANLRD